MQVISQKREKARDNSKLTYRFMFVSHQTDFQDIRCFPDKSMQLKILFAPLMVLAANPGPRFFVIVTLYF